MSISCPACAQEFKMETPRLSEEEKGRQLKEAMSKINFEDIQRMVLPDDITEEISHEAFVEGANAKEIGFRVVNGEPSDLIRGPERFVFNSFVMAYMAAPLVVVPLWAYHVGDWWVLMGILFSAWGTYSGIAKSCGTPKPLILPCVIFPLWAYMSGFWWLLLGIPFSRLCTAIVAMLFLAAGAWFRDGFSIHQYTTLFFCCTLWGRAFFGLADGVQESYAMQSLVANSDLYRKAVACGKIRLVRRPQMPA